MLIVHPYTGDSLGVIDLSPLADADGIPEMDRMQLVGDFLFVTLNTIDHSTWEPVGVGRVAVIDTRADTLYDCDPGSPGTQPITMTLENPVGKLRYDRLRDILYVPCMASRHDIEGGVEKIDPIGMVSLGTATTEEILDGDIFDAVMGPGNLGYAVVNDTAGYPDNFARLVTFDLSTGAVLDTIYEQTSGQGSYLGVLEMNGQGEIYLCDRDATHPGVAIYDASGDFVDKVDVGVPPVDIAFVQTPAGTEPVVESRRLRAECRPNPSSHGAVIRLAGQAVRDLDLTVFDVRGRMIRDLGRIQPADLAGGVRWDGSDEAGNRVSPGVYYAIFAGGETRAGVRVVVTR
jgi:hypothetical protein